MKAKVYQKKNQSAFSVILFILCQICVSAVRDYDHFVPTPVPEDDYEPEERFSRTMFDGDEDRIRNYVSDHEIPRTVPVKIRIRGNLATPAPESGIKLGFIPKQTYYQVRRYDTEVHLPKSAALAEAETAEELVNAPRLREVVSHKKTQEVYEEQGYEDAAYDHGGYKKAGEHHENKLPREHKTDYSRIDDQSTEQAETVNFGRFDNFTTESSHVEPNDRRTRKPKVRGTWSRQKMTTKEKSMRYANSTDATDEDRKPNRRRRVKSTTTENPKITGTKEKDIKIGEESSVHPTLKLVSELPKEVIQPTTYRPPMPADFLANLKKKTKTSEKQHGLVKPLVDSSGYRYENPFGGFVDFNEIKMSPSFPREYKSVLSGDSAHKNSIPKGYIVQKETSYHPQFYRQHKSQLKEPLYASYPREPVLKPKSNKNNYRGASTKFFPYEIIDTKKYNVKTAPPIKKKYSKRTKAKEFPYEIIENADETMPKKYIKHYARLENYADKINDRPQNVENTIFGESDQSPWIPITPKEVYEIHGYERKSPPPAEIKVKENDVSEETVRRKKPLLSPIRVYDQSKSSHTVSTSYSIQHVYPPSTEHKKPTGYKKPFSEFSEKSPHGYKTSMYQFEFPELAESIRLKSFGTTPAVEFFPSLEVDSNGQSANDESITNSPYFENIITNKLLEDYQSTKASKDHQEESFEDPKDIETLSSNRYAIFQRVNYTEPVQEATTSTYDSHVEFNKSYLTESEKLLFRHPHLSRETSYLTDATPVEAINNSTGKRDIILTSVLKNKTNNFSFENLLRRNVSSQSTKVSKRNDENKPEKIIVYPEDYTSSARFVEKLTLAHFADPENSIHKPLPLNYYDRFNTLTNHLKNNSRVKRDIPADYENNEELVRVYLDGSTTEFAVDVEKYPFYKSVPVNGLSKYSVLRYISNPKRVPRKHYGQMSFYESKSNVQCPEVSPPHNIVPKRENGDWAYNPRPKNPRIKNLGDKILCLKMKFFGSDPLDNPFFKEDSIGFPQIFPAKKVRRFEEVEGSDNQYEIIPSWKLSRFKKRRKKHIPYAYGPPPASYVRTWIDSLTIPPFEKPLRKRSAKIGTDHEGRKIVHKVYLAGGFINRKNGSSSNSDESSFGNAIGDVTPLPDDVLDLYVNSQKDSMRDDVPKDDDSNSKLRVTYGLRTVGRFFGRVPENVSSTTIDSSTTAKSSSKGRKKVYVDALSSLRRLQSSSSTEKTLPEVNSSVEAIKYKYDYKEPTWRTKKHQPEPVSKSKLTTAPSSGIDSLLYVIHPETGEGKWMKILKVEELSENDTKADSLGSSNNDRFVVSTRTPNALSHPFNLNSDQQKRKNCQDDAIVTETDHTQTSPPPYDVYHISGLLKQVAPLKASQVEINNLQTTEEHAAEDISEDDKANSFYDLEETQTSTTRIPEPHERLYYYVVDDEGNR